MPSNEYDELAAALEHSRNYRRHVPEGQEGVTSPVQFGPKEPTLFTRTGGQGGRFYGALPSHGGGDVAQKGVRMSVVDVPGSDTYAYPGPTTEPKPSKEFTAVHEVLTQVTHDTGRFYPNMAHHLVEMGERDINRHVANETRNVSHSGNDYSYSGEVDAAHDLMMGGPDGQMKLFGSRHRPGESVVDTMYSTEKARIHAPALLAIAERDTQEKFGRGLVASDNRSNFSEQLTKHVEALTGNKMTERSVSNGSTFIEDEGYGQSRAQALGHRYEEIPAGEVQQGRNMIRGLLKAQRAAKKPPPEVDQPTLF